jgi:phosphate uptake regulator
MLEVRIKELKKELVEYATLVEKMITTSMNGLLERQEAPLRAIIDELEPATNDFEIRLDELCTTAIAQWQPKAREKCRRSLKKWKRFFKLLSVYQEERNGFSVGSKRENYVCKIRKGKSSSSG